MWKIGFEFEFSFLEKKFIEPTSFIEKFVKDKTAWNFPKKAAVLLIATDWHPRSPSTLADP